jgi:hypothetical protein
LSAMTAGKFQLIKETRTPLTLTKYITGQLLGK